VETWGLGGVNNERRYGTVGAGLIIDFVLVRAGLIIEFASVRAVLIIGFSITLIITLSLRPYP